MSKILPLAISSSSLFLLDDAPFLAAAEGLCKYTCNINMILQVGKFYICLHFENNICVILVHLVVSIFNYLKPENLRIIPNRYLEQYHFWGMNQSHTPTVNNDSTST